MNTMKWLLRREFWEHKGGFFWTPLVVGSIITIGTLVSAGAGLALKSQHGMNINGQQVTNLSGVIKPEQHEQIINAVSQGYIAASAPLFMVMAFVIFFFCLGTLFDERKDRSVLFWKSLPVSDGETVLSKLAMALVAAPLITLAFSIVTSFLVLLVAVASAAMTGLNLAGVFAQPATYLAPFKVAAVLPVYLVWALPTVGWLMMVSAWARTKVFLWAVGVPVLTGVLLSWFNAMFDFNWDLEWFWNEHRGPRPAQRRARLMVRLRGCRRAACISKPLVRLQRPGRAELEDPGLRQRLDRRCAWRRHDLRRRPPAPLEG